MNPTNATDDPKDRTISRRHFMHHQAACAAIGAVVPASPSWLTALASSPESDKILIVIQLTGGNDGLNTVIPYANELYRKARPKLGIPAADVLKIDDELGWHPSCRGVAELMQDGLLSVVHGVGYPQPNRSHFESMDIWHTCARKDARVREGWLGRYMAQHRDRSQTDSMGLHLGPEQQPLALASQDLQVPSVAAIESFRLQISDDAGVAASLQPWLSQSPSGGTDALVAFVQAGTNAAWEAGKRIEQILQQQSDLPSFPKTPLGEKLSVIARLITAQMKTRVYYVSLDGFDTHALQPAAHASLLRQWSDALASFVKYLSSQGRADDVLVLTFSEFGRRVAENASDGTDHGAAAPVFLSGTQVTPGWIGSLPSLDNLDDGDLKHQIDFRQIYATIIEDWFGASSEAILGGKFAKSPLLRATLT